MYIRKTRSRKHNYYQLVESYRDSGIVKKKVLSHLGEYETPEAAREGWRHEIAEHIRNGRDEQADKLQSKLSKLRSIQERRIIRDSTPRKYTTVHHGVGNQRESD